ncbi:MAG: nucleoside hydrolase [Hyphomonadaceae bacterium]|nr:nucleoside hydrolase [Hyphomonadaceae bacterium]
MLKFILAPLFALALLNIGSCINLTPDHAPVSISEERPQIIFDTDFGGDADDLGALAMLHRYADREQIDFLAITSWSNEAYVIPALIAVNTYYGRPELALGVRETPQWRTEWNYNHAIAEAFPVSANATQHVEPATALYRRLLAGAKDHSITLVTVGPLANVQNLLLSEPDEISSQSGADLVNQKIKTLVIMGGQFPDGVTANGPEWNFNGNMPGVTQFVLETVQRPIIFSGYEVGEALKVGRELNAHPKDTPLYVGYKFFSEHAPWMSDQYAGEILDNASFDQTAVMFASAHETSPFWTLSAPGRLSADAEGLAHWEETPNGSHRYIILTERTDDAERYIAEAMTHIPAP